MRLLLLLPAAALLPATAVAQTPVKEAPSVMPAAAARAISATAIRGHLAFLSDDLLEGRAPGTRGGRLAARYIASELLAMGLQPPRGGFLQAVSIDEWRPVEQRSTVDFAVRGRRLLRAAWGEEIIAWPGRADTLATVAGELIFVGYGVRAPEFNWDDYEGRDVRGRIALVLVGDPPAPPTEPRLFGGRALTYYGRWTYKLEEARRQGAAGVLLIHTADAAGYPWTVVRSSFGRTQYSLVSTTNVVAPLRMEGWLQVSRARELLTAAGLSFDELLARAARRDFAPVRTGITVSARIAGTWRRIETQNLVGIVHGRERPQESVVYTAHYDHLGIGDPVAGDSIYNGAYDNASGVAALLEVARAFTTLAEAPARSIVFLFTTAEEAGLLGARQYVRTPALPLARTVAAINIDGANLWGETDDFIALGGERSALGAAAENRARELGMRRVADPAPQLGLFFRSDHFPFALAGIPAVQIMHGERYRGRPENWGIEMLARWNASSYHLPSDEYDPAFDLRGAAQQARLLFLLGYDTANRVNDGASRLP